MNYGDEAILSAANEPMELWKNPSDHDYLIHLEHPEFASLCPRSGYPDSGTMVVDYIPDQSIVELKAFKLYINSFRNQRIGHEAVVNVIADRFVQDIAPKSLRVIGDFMRRGGVKMVITVNRGIRYEFPEYKANLL